MSQENKKFDIVGEVNRFKNDQEKLRWSGTFSEYLEKVIENPGLSRSAHRMLYESLTSREDYFRTGPNALFGAERTTDKLVDVLHGGAEGLEVGKRIILFMGPPGGGKSTLANLMKRGLEEYSKTDAGASYAISDCPMHEDPLHLIPKDMRPAFEENYDIHIEGDLCPHCADKYGEHAREEGDQSYGERLANVPVNRFVFSEKERKGIGTFKPSDPKSQDITELVGSVDFSRLAQFGTASDPRAYRFDGELNIANRGVMEFVEMLKSDEKFLYALLDLTQDKSIKAARFPNIYADEVIIAHTNEFEYNNFTQGGKNEALKDRMYLINVPYNLRVSDEQKIYEKLMAQSELVRDSRVHLNPHTLEVASIFAVLTRIEDSKNANISRLQKLKIYDGQEGHDLSQRDLRELQEASPREGMHGLSPRYVIDALSTALIKEGKTCLTPIDALRALRDNLQNHPHTRDMSQADKEQMETDLAVVKSEFDEVAKREVQGAFVYSYEQSANTLFHNYLDNVVAFVNSDKIVDPITEEEVNPDEKLMKSIEEQIGISDNGKLEWRRELMAKIASHMRRGEAFELKSHPRLREAVQNKLFADMKDVVKLTTSTKLPNEEQQRKIGEVEQTLISEKGYCSHCAGELIRYVGTLLAK